MEEKKDQETKELKPLTPFERRWFAAYISNGFNAKEASLSVRKYTDNSARVQGCKTKKRLMPHINNWLEDQGLSDDALKRKGIDLLNARRTQFFRHEGIVTDERTVDDTTTQTKALELMMKVKGLISGDKADVVNPSFNLTFVRPEKKEQKQNG